MKTTALALVLLALANVAHADEAAPSPKISVSVSPIHFIIKVVELQGEYFLAVKAETSNSTAERKRVFPLINLNVGWSF